MEPQVGCRIRHVSDQAMTQQVEYSGTIVGSSDTIGHVRDASTRSRSSSHAPSTIVWCRYSHCMASVPCRNEQAPLPSSGVHHRGHATTCQAHAHQPLPHRNAPDKLDCPVPNPCEVRPFTTSQNPISTSPRRARIHLHEVLISEKNTTGKPQCGFCLAFTRAVASPYPASPAYRRNAGALGTPRSTPSQRGPRGAATLPGLAGTCSLTCLEKKIMRHVTTL
ncbi:hypothetical protein B0J18DRAFT_212230 [Chaetomium sp. MPI-SDFR-AT-0129]|nr:hypothetical protein B0J18DRAFT_212230 [Chaetomium sp. MPI-SDFR-AT-0129]